MKSYITIILILFTAFITYAQNDTIPIVEEDKISNVERIVDKYGGKIVDGFNKVVETATPIAEEGFWIAVKLQLAKGLVHALPILLFFVFMRLLLKERNRILKDNNRMYPTQGAYTSGNTTGFLVIYTIMFFGSLITSILTAETAFTHLIAPEWFAIKEIIELMNL